MEIQTKEIDYCKLEVDYSADKDVVESKRDEIVASLRNVKIPGFRKGKAPDNAIKAKLNKQINVYLSEQMKAQAYDDVVFETQSKPIGRPVFDDVNIKGNSFSCKLTFIKKPDFDLKKYKYEIPKPDVNIDPEADVEKTLENLRLRFGDVQPYEDDDFVERGDQVTVSFEATINGEPFEGSSSEGQIYVVGDRSLPEFDDNLLGMSAGESRKFDVTFPDSYPDIGGKTAEFNVTVHMGVKKVPCALDDEFAKQCGYEKLEELQDQLKKVSNAKVQQAESNQIRNQIISQLLEDNDFKAPEQLVELEGQHIAMQNGVSWDELSDDEKSVFKDQAEKQVKLSLIVDSIREKEPDSVLSDSEAQNGLQQRLQMQGKDPKTFMVEAQKNGTLIGMISALKDEFTLQWLVDQSKIIE